MNNKRKSFYYIKKPSLTEKEFKGLIKLKELIKDGKLQLKEGYGIAPNVIMKDRNIPLEAKILFIYLTCFLFEPLPDTKKICEDLGFPENELEKYLNILIEKNYL